MLSQEENDLLTRVLTYVGNLAEAEKLARHSIELDPLAFAPPFNLARILWFEGKLDEATTAAAKAAVARPASVPTRIRPSSISVRSPSRERMTTSAKMPFAS